MNRKLKTTAAVLLALTILAAAALAGLWFFARANSGQSPELMICDQRCGASWTYPQGQAAPDWQDLPVAAMLDCDRVNLWGLGFAPAAEDRNTGAILMTGSGEEVFRGTLGEAEHFTPSRSGDYELLLTLQSTGMRPVLALYRVQISWQIP